jgi:hypothetical protein
MFWNMGMEGVGVFTGCLANLDADLVKIESHIFVSDTIDGGASCWLQKPNKEGSLVPRFKERVKDGGELPHEWPGLDKMTGYEKHSDEGFLPIRCHCKGVDFRLHRGDYEGKKKEELPWYIDDKNLKPIASFEACDSCRLHSGIDFLNWTFESLQNVSFGDSTSKFPSSKQELQAKVDEKDPSMGTLSYYQSSPHVQRYSCKVCSATVFFTHDKRPEIVDIAIGLLESKDGARAEGFLSWTLGGAVAFPEDMNGGWREDILKGVIREAEEWRVKRRYPKNRRRLEMEEKARQGGLGV